jgi:CRISPR-associated protein Cmr1
VPSYNLAISKSKFRNLEKIDHSEVDSGRVDPLGYLAGMGLIQGGRPKFSYFQPGGHFSLIITAQPQEVEAVLSLFKAFAAAGGRSRNGWGSLAITEKNGFLKPSAPVLQPVIKPFDDVFNCDYPHCLGADTKGLLLWKTQAVTKNWEDCLRELADIYVKTRLSLNIKDRGKQDRHILGYPVTHHSVHGWNRHASGLRLLVRKSETGLYSGYILHISHLFSKEMWRELDTGKQKNIWRKVHVQFDGLMRRAAMEELL